MLPPVIRILCAVVMVFSVFGAQAGVIFTSIYSFGSVQDTNRNPLDGANPQATLIQSSDGNFFGTTSAGGTNGVGTVFKISTNGVLTSLYSFTGGNDGAIPVASLVQGNDGSFYGTTWSGGNDGFGTVFKITTIGEFTGLYSFTGTNDGGRPCAALVQGKDGYLYGTTLLGGVNDLGNSYGTVFRISSSGVLTNLYSFTGTNDGASPRAALVQGGDSYFYGTTSSGGRTNNYGTVFKISTNGVLTTLYFFGSVQDSNSYSLDGASPQAALVLGSDGNFYGTTELDGWVVFWGPISPPLHFGNAGKVFKISPNGGITSLFSFDNDNGTNGANPCAGLVPGSDGSFYGTTRYGGLYGYGTVFRLTIVPEPQLTIIPYGENIVLTWPTNAFVFTLQSSTDIGSSASWSTNSMAPFVIGGWNVVINPISSSRMFYRLLLAR